MATRQAKPEWIHAKMTAPDKQALERMADSQFEGNMSAAIRHCIRVATTGKRPPNRMAPAVT